MPLSDADRTFLETRHAAAMVTVAADGVAKAVRVADARRESQIAVDLAPGPGMFPQLPALRMVSR